MKKTSDGVKKANPAMSDSVPELIADLTLACRERQQLLQAALRAENQLGALERTIAGTPAKRKDRAKQPFAVSPVAQRAAAVTSPVIAAMAKGLRKEIRPRDKRIADLATALPVHTWVQGVRGVGPLSLGLLIGETGDLSGYDSPAKVWKRMGLAVMPDGTRQRRVTGKEGILHGFSPKRRALMFVIGDNLIKQNKDSMTKADGLYRSLYLERKAMELLRLPPDVEKTRKKKNDPEGTEKAYSRTAHAHHRASRYIQKRLLRDLWRAWREAIGGLSPKYKASPTVAPEIAESESEAHPS